MLRSLPIRRGEQAADLQEKQDPIGENRLLRRLGEYDLAALKAHFKSFPMRLGAVLHAPDVVIEQVYFPLSGMISLLAVTQSGDQIETAIVGREGVVGASIGHEGTETSDGQATVQVAGLAWKISAGYFIDVYRASAPFRILMNQFQTVILRQAQQSAACHALHSVEARLCRWLLQSQDTTELDIVPLTQEFLSHMLGVQLSSVSMCAHTLQNAGLISYSRGHITILNRAGLKEAACECYQVVRDYVDKVVPPLLPFRVTG
jgi:CRP-like cAMP-binding protein